MNNMPSISTNLEERIHVPYVYHVTPGTINTPFIHSHGFVHATLNAPPVPPSCYVNLG